MTRALATRSLREPWSGLKAQDDPVTVDTKVKDSVAGSGLRVISVDSALPISAVAVVFRAGSRFEDNEAVHGGAQHLAGLLFSGNASGKTNVTVTRDLLLGTTSTYAQASRETLAYLAEFVRWPGAVESVSEQLAACAAPRLAQWEVEEARESVERALQHRAEGPESLVDAAMWVAYRGSDVARQPIPAGELGTSAEALKEYRKRLLTASNGVLVGVGVAHEDLLSIADRAAAFLSKEKHLPPLNPSRYRGGESHTEAAGAPRFVLAAQSGGRHSRDYFIAQLIQQVLGGVPGRVDTKARPGSGLASRLNRRLSAEAAVLFADAFEESTSDAGLFGVMGQAVSGAETVAIEAVAEQLAALARNPLPDAELLGAKLRAKSHMLRDAEWLDERALFYAHQALYGPSGGKVLCRSSYTAQLDSITAADVQAFAKKAFAGGLTFYTEGNSAMYPSLAELTKRYF